ncbi:MAG: amino acid ABC transporter permease [Meiothermus sp.]|nr:MAG: amino acid ABC transporter permease [Meiothermus sp.]
MRAVSPGSRAQGETRRTILNPHPVALLAAGLGLVALGLPWLELKASRIAAGEAVGVWGWPGSWGLLLLGLWLLLAFVRGPWRGLLLGMALLVWGLLVGQGTAYLLSNQLESARVSAAGGLWLSLLALYVGYFAAYREGRGWAVLSAPLALALLIGLGAFDQLGPVVEWRSWREQFATELWRHLSLSGSAVLLAVGVGVPLGVLAASSPRFGWVLGVMGFLQTIPSLALFGLLLPLLAQVSQTLRLESALALLVVGVFAFRLLWAVSGGLAVLLMLPLGLLALVMAGAWLHSLLGPDPLRIAFQAPLQASGIRGIGAAPAVLALTLYALLPVVLNVYTGLRGVPEAVKDAGRGMGMSPAHLFWRVELPLALPLMLEGIRGAASLTIGITTVAALIGAGGLGFFILRGVEGGAPDMVLLGAIPIIGLALLVDSALRWMGGLLRWRMGI